MTVVNYTLPMYQHIEDNDINIICFCDALKNR